MNMYNLSRTPIAPTTPRLGVALALSVAGMLWGTFSLPAANESEAQRLLTEARAKQTHAQELRAAAATMVQKAADDQLEAGTEERDARILSAQALKLMGADANKQKAFHLRTESRRLTSEAMNMFVAARNSEQKAAQEKRDADELNKAVAQLKDQPTVAATLEAEAKEQMTKAQTDEQNGSQTRFGAQSLDDRAKAAWAEAEKLDPGTPTVPPKDAKSHVAQPRQVK